MFPEIAKSRLRKKLLNYFFANPQASLYLREVASILHEDAGNLCKEFTALEKSGIFCSRFSGKQKYFSLNRAYPVYYQLRASR